MSFETTIIIILIIGFIAVLALIYYLFNSKTGTGGKENDLLLEWLKETRGSISEINSSIQDRLDKTNKAINEGLTRTTKDLNDRLGETNKTINERLDNAAKVISGVQKGIGEVSEIGQQMKGIQDFLTSPKRRGGMGEEVLASLLEQYFPNSEYRLQHKFKNGNTVDAALNLQGRIMPIDSKFSMENYRAFIDAKTEKERDASKRAFINDIRGRIREIHNKYILPEEGTFDFAMMYVPSEAVFYEIINDQGLNDYAREHRVYVTSPNSFLYYLQGVMLSLRGQQVQEQANRILHMISAIKQESDKFGKNLDVLSRHVTNSKNSVDNLASDFLQLKSKIESASNLRVENKADVTDKNLLDD